MITAIHTLIYSDDPEATRRFLSEVLRWPSVGGETGWPIYATGPSELGVHPTSGEGYSTPRHHEIALVCADLDATVAELTSRGATFAREPRDDGWGITIDLVVPGADHILLYQPRHEIAAYGRGE